MSAYTPHTPDDVAAMLAAIGVESIDALVAHVPAALREHARVDLAPGLSEPALRRAMERLAERNLRVPSTAVFLGAGAYPHVAPTVVNRTGRPLRVSVIGDRDSTDCRCAVPPGDSVRLGYYLFSPRSAVRVRDDRGGVARLEAFGDRVDEVSGAVSITVRPEDLRSR